MPQKPEPIRPSLNMMTMGDSNPLKRRLKMEPSYYPVYDSGWNNPLYTQTMAPAVQEDMQKCGKISARNQLKGIVTKITPGAVNSVVEINIGCGNTVTSVITMASVNDLGLRVGSPVTAIIKSSDVILMA